MGGRRATKQELEQIEALAKEGLTCREIARKVGRSENSIRNLRFKRRLAPRILDEVNLLTRQKNELRSAIAKMQTERASLFIEQNNLRTQNQKLQEAVNTNRILLEQTLTKALMNLKQQRPDLFTLTAADQISLLLKALLK